MPIMDNDLVFCESQSIAAVAGNHVHGTNIIYLPQIKNFKGSSINDSPNNGGDRYWNVVVEDENLAAAANGAVVAFYLYNGDTGINPLVDNGGVPILVKVISVNQTSNYKDGAQILSIPLPAGQLRQYFDIYVTVGTQNLSTGKITSWIGGPIQQGS